MSGQATVELCPGTIYIEGGTFSVQGANPTVTGTGGVTIILTADPSAATPSYATASVAGNGTVTLTAPSGDTTITLPDGSSATEKTAGLVFFQDPKAPASSTTGISFAGNGKFTNGCVGDGTANFGGGNTAQLVE